MGWYLDSNVGLRKVSQESLGPLCTLKGMVWKETDGHRECVQGREREGCSHEVLRKENRRASEQM